MYNTIETTSEKRINISATVYETAKSMKGTFSVSDIEFQINMQLEDAEQLTTKQVKSALNNMSKLGTKLQKVNADWYKWN